MQITVEKLTGTDLMRRACEATTGKPSNMSLDAIYRCEHSPIRTQLFWVEMRDIPTFVSVHFRTHSLGITHFVKSNREDSGSYTGDGGRWHPVNHCMLLNAESLINLSKKRLCANAHRVAQDIMECIKTRVRDVDPDLSQYMVPLCEYRNGYCQEGKRSCGMYPTRKGGVNVQ